MYGIYEGGILIARFAAPMAVRSNHPVFTTDTLSLSRLISRRTAQRWEIETRIEPSSYSAQDLFVHVVNKGYSTTFTILTPQNFGAYSSRTASTTPTATGSSGASTVTVASLTGLIPKGTFIKFSNHSKIYMTTADRSGNGSMTIYPPLRAAVSTTTFTYKEDVQMTCYWDLDTISGMAYTDGILMDLGTVKLVEAV